ncbi:hypothetical protein FIBSPDRAFT_121862 [Athelia psychrophila]|uniref:Uncharacterized protein n=1 Tax=Athelia psychrophila TaxID=1759441 RepID=A0A166CQ37_9AGAM|nr:hypothetical protein FIBSPDRAFT_121862 [Fibularhizoctonia sp. CBS 109695]
MTFAFPLYCDIGSRSVLRGSGAFRRVGREGGSVRGSLGGLATNILVRARRLCRSSRVFKMRQFATFLRCLQHPHRADRLFQLLRSLNKLAFCPSSSRCARPFPLHPLHYLSLRPRALRYSDAFPHPMRPPEPTDPP